MAPCEVRAESGECKRGRGRSFVAHGTKVSILLSRKQQRRAFSMCPRTTPLDVLHAFCISSISHVSFPCQVYHEEVLTRDKKCSSFPGLYHAPHLVLPKHLSHPLHHTILLGIIGVLFRRNLQNRRESLLICVHAAAYLVRNLATSLQQGSFHRHTWLSIWLLTCWLISTMAISFRPLVKLSKADSIVEFSVLLSTTR